MYHKWKEITDIVCETKIVGDQPLTNRPIELKDNSITRSGIFIHYRHIDRVLRSFWGSSSPYSVDLFHILTIQKECTGPQGFAICDIMTWLSGFRV